MSKSAKYSFLIYSFFLAVLFLLVRGYQFNISDQEEHLPQVYSLIDKTLYSSDFFINSWKQTFTVREFYIYLIYIFSFLASVSVICFALTVVCLTFTAFGIIKITRIYSENLVANLLAPFLVLILFYKYTVGGNFIQYNMLICSSLAKPIAVFGIYYYLKEKYNFSAILFGIATLFQVLVGFQLFIVFAFLFLFKWKEVKFMPIVQFKLLFLLFSGGILFPIIYRQFFVNGTSELFYQLLYYFRSPAHYYPSLFPKMEWIKFLSLSAIGLGLSVIYKRQEMIFIYLLIFSGLLLYSVLLEGFNISWIGKIQWFKTTIWLNMFSCIAIAIGIGKKFSIKQFSKYFKPLSLIGIACGLFVVLFSNLFKIENEKYQVGLYIKKDLTLIHEWIEHNTDKKSLFLSLPSDNSFLCQAKRSGYISFFPLIHEQRFMSEWYGRVTQCYGITLNDGLKNIALAKAEINYNEKMPLELDKSIYRIIDYRNCSYLNQLKIIHKQGNYALAIAK